MVRTTRWTDRFTHRRCGFPALFVVLAVALVAGYWVYVAAALIYMANVLVGGGRSLGPLTHTWSLAQEEQFYAVWPLALLAALRRGLQARTIALAAGALAAVVFAWRTYLALNGAPITRLAYAPDTQADAVLIGCCLALVATRRTIPASRWLPIGGAAVLGYLSCPEPGRVNTLDVGRCTSANDRLGGGGARRPSSPGSTPAP